MRILFTFVGGNGHFQPLVPIAQACEAVGHTVIFGCSYAMRPTVEALGFVTLAMGEMSTDSPQRTPLLPLSMEREEDDLREKFARQVARRRAKDIVFLCMGWLPDLVVCDEVDFGAMIAAEYLRIPHATVLVIASGSFIRPEIVAHPLNEIRAEYGLPPDPTLAMLSRYLVLSPIPPGYRDPAFPLPSTAQTIQPFARSTHLMNAPMPFNKYLPDAPTIYFTLGTVFNLESGDLFSRVLAGLRELALNVVVTVGHHIDPAEFGPQPNHIHIAHYIPQLTLLPYCQLVISHGGSGSVIATLAHGVPMVLIPMGADQPLNAARCEQLGVACILDPIVTTSELVREAVTHVLDMPSYRQTAEHFRDIIATMPEPAYAVTLLEQLGSQPLL